MRATEAGPVWSGLVWSDPVQSVADAGVVSVAWSAAVGAPFGGSMVLFGTWLVLEESNINVNSGGSGDQMKVPRVVAWTSKQAVG